MQQNKIWSYWHLGSIVDLRIYGQVSYSQVRLWVQRDAQWLRHSPCMQQSQVWSPSSHVVPEPARRSNSWAKSQEFSVRNLQCGLKTKHKWNSVIHPTRWSILGWSLHKLMSRVRCTAEKSFTEPWLLTQAF